MTNPNQSKWTALTKIIKRQPADLTDYGSALGAIVIAYTWVIALGSQAVARGVAQPLLPATNGAFRRLWSLFREGLRYFAQVVRRHSLCLGFVFIPDFRFT